MDFEMARFNMIEQQIRPWEVLDAGVLELLRQIPREAFVSEAQRGLAFADLNLPIGHDEAMWQPKIEARILQALAPKARDHVLEVGTGSGYLTALLASCSEHVTSVEIHSDFIGLATERLQDSEHQQCTTGRRRWGPRLAIFQTMGHRRPYRLGPQFAFCLPRYSSARRSASCDSGTGARDGGDVVRPPGRRRLVVPLVV